MFDDGNIENTGLFFDIDKYQSLVKNIEPIKFIGEVSRVKGLSIECIGPTAKVGEVCKIILKSNNRAIFGEVIGIDKDKTTVMTYDEMEGIQVGDQVIATGEFLNVYVGDYLLGRVLDGVGKDYDGKGLIGSSLVSSIFNQPTDALKRKPIREPLTTGIKAIDSLLTIGKGQRIGIFAGTGVGKSTILGMIARNSTADVNVIALVGERSRELNEFIHYELGEEGLKKSVIVFASSNKNALCRVRGAYVATTIAEYFRDQGKDVLLMMDSITRFAMAQREIGLSLGEPPSSKGYTPSVLTLLPKLLERAGTGEKGSITGIYTVLIEADNMNDPIGDAVRGILDGHIILDRKLANKNHYPAIDILGSISRLMIKITNEEHQYIANLFRELLTSYKENEDLISFGAYTKGTNPKTDAAILLKELMDRFLKQAIDEGYSFDESFRLMKDTLSPILNTNENEEEPENINIASMY